jgi:hypothetical protein
MYILIINVTTINVFINLYLYLFTRKSFASCWRSRLIRSVTACTCGKVPWMEICKFIIRSKENILKKKLINYKEYLGKVGNRSDLCSSSHQQLRWQVIDLVLKAPFQWHQEMTFDCDQDKYLRLNSFVYLIRKNIQTSLHR